MRNLQRAAEAALEQAPAIQSRSFQERFLHAGLGEGLGRVARRGLESGEGRTERLLSGLERELTKRLNSVLERLDLPTRRELKALDDRIRNLEEVLTAQPPPKPRTKRKTTRSNPKNS
jgi:BMFP domain-containing protein YqiC